MSGARAMAFFWGAPPPFAAARAAGCLRRSRSGFLDSTARSGARAGPRRAHWDPPRSPTSSEGVRPRGPPWPDGCKIWVSCAVNKKGATPGTSSQSRCSGTGSSTAARPGPAARRGGHGLSAQGLGCPASDPRRRDGQLRRDRRAHRHAHRRARCRWSLRRWIETASGTPPDVFEVLEVDRRVEQLSPLADLEGDIREVSGAAVPSA